MDLIDKLKEYDLTLSVNTGRCGTKFLAGQLNRHPDIIGIHEVDMVRYLPYAKAGDVGKVIEGLQKIIIPNILRIAENKKNAWHIVLTSHLSSKGFLEAFDLLGIRYRLLNVWRKGMEIATSFWQLNDIPGRTASGKRWLLAPSDPITLTTISKQVMLTLTDFQLCCWYVDEVMQRWLQYEEKRKCAVFNLHNATSQLFDANPGMLNVYGWILRRDDILNIVNQLAPMKLADADESINKKIGRKQKQNRYMCIPLTDRQKQWDDARRHTYRRKDV